jgi:hypothetical protein
MIIDIVVGFNNQSSEHHLREMEDISPRWRRERKIQKKSTSGAIFPRLRASPTVSKNYSQKKVFQTSQNILGDIKKLELQQFSKINSKNFIFSSRCRG